MTTRSTETRKRLVIDLTRRSRADLAWLVETEEMNKTTVCNRAIQVYKLIIETQERGGNVMVDGERLVIL